MKEEKMKKLLTILMFTLVLVVGIKAETHAEGEIELYPYDKLECLQALDTCTNYKVGDSHWDAVYNGYRYNTVNGNVRYVSDFSDDNFDGFIDATEMTSNGWSSFGGFIFNIRHVDIIFIIPPFFYLGYNLLKKQEILKSKTENLHKLHQTKHILKY